MAPITVMKTLQKLSKLPSPGPSPAFTHVHMGQAILAIGDEGPIGRIELSRRLSVGEGAVRTIIKHLTKASIIRIAAGGCVLTNRGTLLYNSLRAKVSKISIVDAKDLALDKFSAAILVRASGHRVRRGLEQRDAAILAGATGACTLIFRGQEFLMPMGEGDEWKLGKDALLFQNLTFLSPKEEDVVVISSASGKVLAEQAAMAAALTLIA